MSPLYYNIPFDSQYNLDTALKDDIDELWHKDIEQLEQILDAELKEAEWVNHELHSRKKKNYSYNSDNKEETYGNARRTIAVLQVWVQTTYCRW